MDNEKLITESHQYEVAFEVAGVLITLIVATGTPEDALSAARAHIDIILADDYLAEFLGLKVVDA